MIKHLYDEIARRWISNSNSVWIISDPHFGDEEARAFRGDSFPGDDGLVKAINRKVGKNDTIVFLGDIGDLEYVKRIRGYKVLLLGNHDKGASNYRRQNYVRCPKCHHRHVDAVTDGHGNLIAKCPNCNHHGRFDRSWEYDDGLFDEVYEGPLMINDRTILSHEPIMGLPPYMFNIHGHKHDIPFDWDACHRNVCAEAIGYEPINLIKLFNDGLLKSVESIHRQTIDNATKRKRKGR